jgi:hypothetical protein
MPHSRGLHRVLFDGKRASCPRKNSVSLPSGRTLAGSETRRKDSGVILSTCSGRTLQQTRGQSDAQVGRHRDLRKDPYRLRVAGSQESSDERG